MNIITKSKIYLKLLKYIQTILSIHGVGNASKWMSNLLNIKSCVKDFKISHKHRRDHYIYGDKLQGIIKILGFKI